ncbi:YGGT family protein [Raphanus sativus]|uniref:YlmG homolog protein 2, chloroplastic-like n=1 Tax=Raphanus sativus TaxID=3726 RepID=A0A9W3CZW9_RAPSA|nr:ylmG homolog protein 2, chloroplastic-like [Raphanus sativus]KAJ4866856.1 YGGT family protein [Raphanus sativus]
MEEASSANEPAIKRSLKPSPSGPIPNFFVSLSSAFTQKTQLARPNKPNLLLQPPVSDSVKLIQDLHRSLASVTEKFSGFFHSFAGRNPLFHEAVRLSSEFRGLCDEVRLRNTTTRVSFAMANHGFAAVLPGDSVAGLVVANGLINFLNIYSNVLVLRLVLTWFPTAPPVIVSPLSTLCDPYLNLFRGVIPPLGGLDLSPILAFLVLNAFTSSAMALPCELPPAEGAASPSSPETKWTRRRRLASTKRTIDR